MKRFPLLAGARIAPATLLCALLSAPAGAATILVDSPGDDLDLGANGNCTLREAVVAANTDAAVDACPAGSGADVIELSSGVFSFAIAGAGEDGAATGDLDVTGELTIEGLGADVSVIDAAELDRVFEVHGTSLTLRSLGVTGGRAEGATAARGGALLASDASVTLEAVRLAGNRAEGPSSDQGQGGNAYGGAIYLDGGSLAVSNSALSDNEALGGSSNGAFVPPGHGDGGAIWSNGQVTLDHSSVTRNFAYDHSAIYSSGVLDLFNVTVHRNQTGISCSLSCIFGEGQVTNAGGLATLEHVTIGTGAFYGDLLSTGETTLRATVISGFCKGDPVSSLGYNQSHYGDCGLAHPTDIVGVDPLLHRTDEDELVVLLLPRSSSALVDSADDGACPATDARGTPRPVDGDGDGNASCDRGAAELVCDGPDSDGDGFADVCDLCPDLPNPDQLDPDGDGVGSACDNCPDAYDPSQRDVDGDGLGDVCDDCTDGDGDGYQRSSANHEPGCPGYPDRDCNDMDPNIHPGQTEIPGNGIDDDCNDATPACGPAEIGVETPVDARAPGTLLLLALAPLAWRARRAVGRP